MIVPYVGVFVISFAVLFFLLGFILPEKYSKWFWHILIVLSITSAIILTNYQSPSTPIKEEVIEKKESYQQKEAKSCLREERRKGRNKEDAELFCYNACIVDIMSFGDESFISAEVECDSIFVD